MKHTDPTTDYPKPTPGWPQRAGRMVPFPPGTEGQGWETVLDRKPGEREP